MDLDTMHISPDVWRELSRQKPPAPEEGDPRRSARELWTTARQRAGSSCSDAPQQAAPNSQQPAAAGSACTPPQPTGGAPASGVERRRVDELSYSDFVRDFMAPNVPVIIEGAAEGWRARREWVCTDGRPDLDFLERHFGSARVKATDTARAHEGCGPVRGLTLSEFVAWWRQHQAARSAGDGGGSSGGGASGELLYVKDWHFTRDFPQYQAYTCPPYFADDWLNEWYDERCASLAKQHTAAAEPPAEQCDAQPGPGGVAVGGSAGPAAARGAGGGCRGADDVASDYRFVYLGPKGSWTPLHSDVLRSHSWSTNVAGRKRWRMLHPRYTHLLYDKWGQDIAPDFWLLGCEGEGKLGEHEADAFPGLAQVRAHVIEFVQEAGESVFVPSGWHHSVENLEDTLSINHNWINGHNVHWTWHLVAREYREAEEGIEDCRQLSSPAEFEGLVQRNMLCNCGMDFATLGQFMRSIAQRSVAHLETCGTTAHEALLAARSGAGGAGGGGGPYHACCGMLPPCCAHHALRLQRAGQVLQRLTEAQRRIADGCRQAPAGVGGGAAPAQHAREGCPAGPTAQQEGEQAPHEEEIAANRECLARMRDVLCDRPGMARLVMWEV